MNSITLLRRTRELFQKRSVARSPSFVACVAFVIAASIAVPAAHAGGYAEAVMSANPTAYFPLNDTSGVTATNSVASPVVSGTYFDNFSAVSPLSGGVAATIQQSGSGPNLMQAGPGLPGFSSGNYAVGFAGPSGAGGVNQGIDNMRITNSATAFGTDYTYQVWVYNTTPTSSQPITGYIGGRFVQSNFDAIAIWGNHNGTPGGAPGRLGVLTSDGNAFFGSGTSATLAVNTWYNVALTRSGSTLSLYCNGILLGSTTSVLSSPQTAPNNQFFSAGVRVDGNWALTGRLDEISLTNRALTAAEIKASYNAALYPTVYWSGSSGIWSEGAAWSTTSGSFSSADAGAGGGQDAVFNLGTSQTIRLNGSQRVNSFTFSSSGSSVLLGGTTGTPAANSLQVGTALNSGGITIDAGAGAVTIGDTSGTSAAVNLSLAGNQTWENRSSNTFTVANNVGGSAASGSQSLTIGGSGATTILGAITNGTAGGTISLVKQGDGTLRLSGNSSYSGATNVTAGTVVSENRASFGTGTVSIGSSGIVQLTARTSGTVLNQVGSYYANGVTNTVTGSGVLQLVGSNDGYGVNYSGDLSGFTGTVSATSGFPTGFGNVNNPSLNLTGSNARFVVSGAGFFVPVLNATGTIAMGELSGNGTIKGNPVIGSSTLLIGGLSTSSTFSGIFQDNGANTKTALTKVGTGTLTLSGNSTHSGVTNVNAGTIVSANLASFGTGTVSIGSSGIVQLTARTSGTVLNQVGSYYANGVTNTVTGSGVLQLVGSNDGYGVNYSGDLSGFTGTVSATSGFPTGFGNVNNPSLNLTGSNARFVVSGAGFFVPVLNATGTIAMGELSGNGSIKGNPMIGSSTLLVGGLSTSSTFSGILQDNGGGKTALTKVGNGTLTLSGNNTFSGDTTISGGILSIVAGSALQGSSGVGIADAARLRYTGGAGSFARNISVTSGTGTVENAGGALLTLSGTLTKNGTVLRLTGGQFNVTGQIVGASANSDLLVDGTSTVTLSNTNTYNGPTFVNQSSTLVLGTNNAIPNNSLVTLGDATTTGTLNMNGFTDAIGGLSFGAAGGTLRLAATSTSAAPLTAPAGTMTLTNGTLDLAGSGTTAGLYRVLAAQTVSGSFASVTNASAAYQVLTTATSVDYQQRAVLGAVSVTNPAVAIITGGSAAFTYSVANTALSGGASLAVTGTGLSNVFGSSSGTAAAAGSTGSLSGLVFTGTSIGNNQQGTFTVNAPSAYGTTTATGTVAVTVLDHATSSLASGSSALLSTVLNLGTWDYSTNLWTTGTSSGQFSIFNLASTFGAGLTADLSLVSVSGTGNGFTTNLDTYTDIAGGQSRQYSVFVNPNSFLTSGTQSWTFTIGMSDKTGMSGATATNTLSVTANVVVVPEPGAIALAGIAIPAAAYMLRRRRRMG